MARPGRRPAEVPARVVPGGVPAIRRPTWRPVPVLPMDSMFKLCPLSRSIPASGFDLTPDHPVLRREPAPKLRSAR